VFLEVVFGHSADSRSAAAEELVDGGDVRSGSELGEEATRFGEVTVAVSPERYRTAPHACVGMGALEDVAERRPARRSLLVQGVGFL
jgi:hypothetical protein